MLTFSFSPSTALSNHATEGFFVLKLYYNDETAYIGVSDKDRNDGGDIYYGIVSAWGSLTHSLDFFNFTTSTMNMSVKLINSDNTIQGGRFSDLFSTLNFANRKWELFQNANSSDTLDAAANMIGSGIISGDIGYSESFISLKLLDFSSRYHKQIPINVIDSTTFTNAPQNNIGAPFPIPYGDFHDNTNIGTIPTDTFDQHYNFNPVPAIITTRWNQAGEFAFAQIDSTIVDELDADNIYMEKDGNMLNCLPANIDIASSPIIKFRGVDWSYYTLLSPQSGEEDGSDGDFDTETAFTVTGVDPWVTEKFYGIPKIPKLGVVTQIRIIVYWKFTGDAPGGVAGDFFGRLTPQDGNSYIFENGWNPEGDGNFNVTKYVIPFDGVNNTYTAVEADQCDLEGEIFFTIVDDIQKNGTATLTIQEVGMEVTFASEQVFSKNIQELYEVNVKGGFAVQTQFENEAESFNETIIKSRTVTIKTPADIDYVFASGKGRQFMAWVDADSRNQGYNKADLIQNPVFMIEDALRAELGLITTGTATVDSASELVDDEAGQFSADLVGQIAYNVTDGTNAVITAFTNADTLVLDSDAFPDGDEDYRIQGLTSDEIDHATFDASGNTSTGHIKDIFNDAVSDIKFAFSQYKFINSKDFVNRICSQILSWVFIGGDGKFKIKTLRRPADYTAADKTIDFKDIDLKGISRTSLGGVRNDITVKYNQDYGKDQFLSSVNDTDGTSQGANVNGIAQALKLELDADTLDSTTATQLADAYKTIFKDRKNVIQFDCKRAIYNELEIGDDINFANWDDSIKIYGTTFRDTSPTERITDSDDRDFAGSNNWVNQDIGGLFNSSGDLTLTATAIGEYCYLPFTAITPILAGEKIVLKYDHTERTAGWAFSLEETGAPTSQALGDAVAGTGQTITFISDSGLSSSDQLRITAKTNNTAEGDFDNFSLAEASDFYKVQSISKRPNGCSITAIKVS